MKSMWKAVGILIGLVLCLPGRAQEKSDEELRATINALRSDVINLTIFEKVSDFVSDAWSGVTPRPTRKSFCPLDTNDAGADLSSGCGHAQLN